MATDIKPQRGKTIIVQGGQWGSEGKGQIAAYLAKHDNAKAAVRTGSINAGHTVYYKGVKCSMQLIPTAWIHPEVFLFLGAGCYIEPEILAREVELIRSITGEDVTRRLFIDYRCVWFGEAERERSKEANRHHAMGATGKGCSEAIVSKSRDRGDNEAAFNRLFRNHPDASLYRFIDTTEHLDDLLRAGHNVLLEGTQGAMLDFNLGPYPYVTSRMTNAAAWLAETGLPPVNVETTLVLRAKPIRVAGNSGPMPEETTWPKLMRVMNSQRRAKDLPEIVPSVALDVFEQTLEAVIEQDWPEVADRLGNRATQFDLWTTHERIEHRVCLSEANARALHRLPFETLQQLAAFELTTVTKKMRRIAHFSLTVAREAVRMNAPTRIAYTFLNYDFPDLWDECDFRAVLHHRVADGYLNNLSNNLGAPVQFVSTGKLQEHVLNLHA